MTPDTTPAHTYAYRGLDAQLTRVAAAVESGELDGRRSTTVCALAARAGRIRFVLTRKHAVAAKVPHATRQTVVVSSRQEGVVDHRPVRTKEELTPIHTQTYDFLLISKSKTPDYVPHMAMHETVDANGVPTVVADNFHMDCQG